MAERVYTTEGIILRRRSVGEANVLVSVFTHDLGLIEASVQSARRENSKLRFGLSSFAYGAFSVVPGEHSFKLIGTRIEGVFGSAGNRVAARTLGRIGALLLRVMPRAEAHVPLFAYVREGFRLLERESAGERIAALEAAILLRTLAELGYVPEAQEFEKVLAEPVPTTASVDSYLPLRLRAVAAVNKALGASGL